MVHVVSVTLCFIKDRQDVCVKVTQLLMCFLYFTLFMCRMVANGENYDSDAGKTITELHRHIYRTTEEN